MTGIIIVVSLTIVIVALIYNQLQLKKLIDCLDEQERRLKNDRTSKS